MAPRKGETADQKAQRYNQRAQFFIHKARYERVFQALKASPHVLPDVERQLVDLGVMESSGPGGAGGVKVESKSSAGQVDETVGGASEPSEQKGSMGMAGAVGVDDEKKAWDRNLTKIEHLGPSLLVEALQHAEPAAFSPGNIKSITKRGARNPAKLTPRNGFSARSLTEQLVGGSGFV